MKTNFFISKAACKKLALSLVLAGVAFGSFATLGDGKSNRDKPRKLLVSTKTSSLKPGAFSLQTGYSFRGSQVISEQETRTISLNSPTVIYQRGNAVYTLPVRKKVTLNLNSQKTQVPGATVNINF